MGDNGSKPDKTKEEVEAERLEAKKARFAQNPDSFIAVEEIIMAAIRKPGQGIGITIVVTDGLRTEMDVAISELNHRVQMILMERDIKQAHESSKKIITPGHKHFGAFGFKRQ